MYFKKTACNNSRETQGLWRKEVKKFYKFINFYKEINRIYDNTEEEWETH